MIDMTEGEAEYLKYRFKQYLGSVSRAIQNKRLKEQKMELSIDEAIKRFQNNAEYERTHGNLQGCLEFRQLAEWLCKYQAIKEIYDNWNVDFGVETHRAMSKIGEVLENG